MTLKPESVRNKGSNHAWTHTLNMSVTHFVGLWRRSHRNLGAV